MFENGIEYVVVNRTNGQIITHCIAMSANAVYRHIAQNDDIAVYPMTVSATGEKIGYNIIRGALQAAYSVAKKALDNGGTDTQRQISDNLRIANKKASMKGVLEMGDCYLLDIIHDMHHDAVEYVGHAQLAIIDAIDHGQSIMGQYHSAYLAINAYIASQRTATAREVSTEYLQSVGGDLIPIDRYIAKIISDADGYIPAYSNTIDADLQARLYRALSGAMDTLTPRQKQVAKLSALHYSNRQIAEMLHVKSWGTISDHIKKIQKRTYDHIAVVDAGLIDIFHIKP